MSPAMSFLTMVAIAISSVAALGPGTVPLGTSGNYAILAKSGVSTVPQSAITGNVGLSPAAGSFLTGFSLTMSPLNTFSTSTQVAGQLSAASYTSPTPSTLTTAISNMETAYNNAATLANPNFLNLQGGALGGQVLTPGLYKFTSAVGASSDFTISGTALDTWIFQVDGGLTIAAAKKIILAGGALSKHIVWVVAGSVAFDAGSKWEGIVLAKTSVTLKTGATLNGRILSQTNVALQQATVTQPL